MNSHGQRNRGRRTSVPILPPRATGPHQYSPVNEIAHQLPTGRSPNRARSPAALSWSPRSYSQPSQWQGGEQASFHQGALRSHMPTLTRRGNKAAPTTSLGRGNLCHTTRTPRERGIRATEQPSMLTATNWPGQCTPVRTRHTLVPGATPRPLPHVATPNPAFAGHPLGGASMGLCAGRVAAPGRSL